MQKISEFLVNFIGSHRTAEAVPVWERTVVETLAMLAIVMTVVMTILD